MPDNTPISNVVIPYINNIISKLKYIVLFILYLFTFKYLFVENTVAISFVLLLILHILFLGLIGSDIKLLSYNILSFSSSFGSLLSNIINIGPVISWILLFIGISLIVSVYSHYGFYYDKTGKSLDLGKKNNNIISIFKVLAIISSVLLWLLYIINLLLTNNPQGSVSLLNIGDINIFSSGFRILATTLFLFSFLLYFYLVKSKNYFIFWVAILFFIFFYLSNFNNVLLNILSNFYLIPSLIIGILLIAFISVFLLFYNDYETLIGFIPTIAMIFYSLYIYYWLNIKIYSINKFKPTYLYMLIVPIVCSLTSLSVYYSVKLNKGLQLFPDT